MGDLTVIPLPPRPEEESAESVGGGVKAFVPLRAPKPPAKRKQRVVSLDAPQVWVSKPTKPDQIGMPNEARLAKRETRVFDLAVENDLKQWNDVQSRAVSPLADLAVLSQEKNFCNSTENWKILVTIQYFEFRDFLDNEGQEKLRKEHEQNGNSN